MIPADGEPEQSGPDEFGLDQLGLGGSGLAGLMAQAQQMQQQLLAAQDQLAQTEVTGTAGGGLVTATVTGVRRADRAGHQPDRDRPRLTPRASPTWCWRPFATPTARRPSCSSRRWAPSAGGLGGLSLPGM